MAHRTIFSYDYTIRLVIPLTVPSGPPSRGGDVTVYVFDINKPSLPAPSYSVLVSVSVFMSLSTVFHSVPTGSPSRGGGVAIYVFDINQPGLPTPFYSIPVSISVFMALSTAFHSINSPDNSPVSHSVLPVLSLPYWFFQLYIPYESLLQP